MLTYLKKTERVVESLQNNNNGLTTAVNSNTVRIGRLEDKTFNLSLSVKGIETKIMKRITNLELWIESATVEKQLNSNESSILPDPHRSCPQNFQNIRVELAEIQESKSGDQEALKGIQGSVKYLQSKLDETVADLSASTALMGTRTDDTPHPGSSKSLIIVKLGIERYVQQINQLTSTTISGRTSDLKLIEKCNNVDVPKVSKAVTSCGDALEKYVKLPNMDTEYVDEVSTILVSASNWCLSVEELYSRMEIHSITNTKGDTSEVGILTDNSSRTVYEFLQDVELAIMGWGSQAQRANRLITKHLSPTIRDRIIDKAHNFQEIKLWLIEHYGDASRIVNDTITALAKKKKPSPNFPKDRYKFYSEIVVSILRLERLTKEKIN